MKSIFNRLLVMALCSGLLSNTARAMLVEPITRVALPSSVAPLFDQEALSGSSLETEKTVLSNPSAWTHFETAHHPTEPAEIALHRIQFVIYLSRHLSIALRDEFVRLLPKLSANRGMDWNAENFEAYHARRIKERGRFDAGVILQAELGPHGTLIPSGRLIRDHSYDIQKQKALAAGISNFPEPLHVRGPALWKALFAKLEEEFGELIENEGNPWDHLTNVLDVFDKILEIQSQELEPGQVRLGSTVLEVESGHLDVQFVAGHAHVVVRPRTLSHRGTPAILAAA